MNKNIYWWTLIIAIVTSLLLIVDLNTTNHPVIYFEEFPIFYILIGFFSCAAIVIISKILGVVLKRPQDYYQSMNNSKLKSRDSND